MVRLSSLADVIADDEDLARFITQSNWFGAQTPMAKPAAFLPSPKYRETSVSRHGSNPRERLWELGKNATHHRNLYGAAIFKASTVRECKLQVIADEPPPRHAAIRGWLWYDADPELQKAQQKEMALVIASKAELILH